VGNASTVKPLAPPSSSYIGKKFGLLLVLGEEKREGPHDMLLCLCECGNKKIIRKSRFNEARASSRRFSCGCKKGGRPVEHGESNTKLYRVWDAMLRRCHNKSHKAYPRYGARGIFVCFEWHKYIVFRDWALANGYQQGLTIERKNNDLGYFPENCCWATRKQQANNRRVCVYYEHKGEVKTLTQWSEAFNISRAKTMTLLEKLDAKKRTGNSAGNQAKAFKGACSPAAK